MKVDITLYYYDKIGKQIIIPIAEEAERRGYTVKLTNNYRELSNVGIYTDHRNYQFCAKHSVIMLHDMGQMRSIWPDFWREEPWCLYDLGILPGYNWMNLWQKNTYDPRAYPKKGMVVGGWPKSDIIFDKINRCKPEQDLRERLGLKYDFTVLYAPSWELDNKQNDVVEALHNLKINVLLKQALFKEPEIKEEVVRQNEMHRGKYNNVYIVDPAENIMNCLEISNLVISDGSCVMNEAVLFNIPSIAVEDWKMPLASGTEKVDIAFDYFVTTRKNDICKTVMEIMDDYGSYVKNLEVAKNNEFSYLGKASERTMDAIEQTFFGIDRGVDFLLPRMKKQPLAVKNSLMMFLQDVRLRLGWLKWSVIYYFKDQVFPE